MDNKFLDISKEAIDELDNYQRDNSNSNLNIHLKLSNINTDECKLVMSFDNSKEPKYIYQINNYSISIDKDLFDVLGKIKIDFKDFYGFIITFKNKIPESLKN